VAVQHFTVQSKIAVMMGRALLLFCRLNSTETTQKAGHSQQPATWPVVHHIS